MKSITCDSETGARQDIATWGPDWFGLIYFRMYATPDAWMTFYGVKLLWFTVVVNIPAKLSMLIGENRKREPWV